MILCPLPKWTPLSPIDHCPFFFTSSFLLSFFILLPLRSSASLMVSVAVDGTINQRWNLVIITTETNWAHTPRPWKAEMSLLGMIHTMSDMHNGCPMGRCPLVQVYLLWVDGRLFVCVCVWESYESSNGFPSLMWGTWPIPSPVSHENVSHDEEGLEQVYDIISVLPQQRYDTERPDSLIYPQGLKLCKQSQNFGAGCVNKCFVLSQTEWDTADSEVARKAVWTQSKRYTLKVKQETYKCVVGEADGH